MNNFHSIVTTTQTNKKVDNACIIYPIIILTIMTSSWTKKFKIYKHFQIVFALAKNKTENERIITIFYVLINNNVGGREKELKDNHF